MRIFQRNIRPYMIFPLLIFFFSLGLVQAQQRGLYDLPDPFNDPVSISSNIAVTRSGRILSSNPFVNRFSIIGLERGLDADLDIGESPSSLAILASNFQAVALAQDKLVLIDLEENSILAEYPLEGDAFGMVANNEIAYISLQSANEVIAMSLADGEILSRIPTPPAPAALALWGDFLYLSHFYTGEFSLIYLPTNEVVRTIQTDANAGLSASIEINPIQGRAYLPQTVAIANELRPMLYEVDLLTMTVLRGIDLGIVLDGAAAIPFAARQPSNRSRLYISLAGSNGILVLNLDDETAVDFIETGLHPRGLIFSPNYGLLYVQNALDGTVSIFDTRFFALEDQIPSSAENLGAQAQIAGRLFYTSDRRLNPNETIACASCHWDLGSDGGEWFGLETAMISANEIEGAWLNAHIEMMMQGEGLELESIDMDALIAFLRR